jgi:RNA polymerase sigma-70 factor (ECF subfamily)
MRCPEAFGELYSWYFPQVWRYLAGRLGPDVAGRLGPDVADDLAAETFLDAFRQRGRFGHIIRIWSPFRIDEKIDRVSV